mmetsp:Transcript_31083/g.76087  ORF Transcript_31083/g.76087 Transcript_31083/m.76087 type:complete len:274 (-) Transcript_31083:428-1249(-)
MLLGERLGDSSQYALGRLLLRVHVHRRARHDVVREQRRRALLEALGVLGEVHRLDERAHVGDPRGVAGVVQVPQTRHGGVHAEVRARLSVVAVGDAQQLCTRQRGDAAHRRVLVDQVDARAARVRHERVVRVPTAGHVHDDKRLERTALRRQRRRQQAHGVRKRVGGGGVEVGRRHDELGGVLGGARRVARRVVHRRELVDDVLAQAAGTEAIGSEQQRELVDDALGRRRGVGGGQRVERGEVAVGIARRVAAAAVENIGAEARRAVRQSIVD